jgi:serine/threonine protein phosphatase PrpC
MPLEVTTGHATATGPRPQNEDFVGMVTPTGDELARKGIVLAIADGVSGHAGGREAAEYAVRGLLTDYYATPDTWETTVALDRVIIAINRWVISQAQARREVSGMATTLTALVLRGRRAVFAHLGDTRAYRLRGGVLQRLTIDHVWDRPDMAHVLKRAVGLDSDVRVDYGEVDLAIGDRFLLLCDGVWSVLTDQAIGRLSANHRDAQALADALIEDSLAAGTKDNASALVADIQSIPDDALNDVLAAMLDLPIPPLLKPGTNFDGFRVTEILHRNGANILYRVDEVSTGRACVLKTIAPERATDVAERRQLAHEEWLARRVVARFFPQVIPVASDRRSALYYVQTWHEGQTLAQALDGGMHFTVPELLAIAIKLARGVGALHRRSIIHRDIKPGNVHLGQDTEVRILDLGVAESGLAAGMLTARAGTPSYLAPELIAGGAASWQTDLYALGVTLYYALTRRYPYGEVEPFQRPRFGDPTTPSRYRPDLPKWFENLLLKLVAKEPRERFETAEELLIALEQGAAHTVTPPQKSLATRDPLDIWRGIAIASIVLNLLLIYVVLVAR